VPIPNEDDVIVADVRELGRLVPAMDGIDAVIHLAGVSDSKQAWETVAAVGIGGTYNVLEAAREAGVKQVIYASSILVHAWPELLGRRVLSDKMPVRPDSFYGIGKATGELIGRQFAEKEAMSVICLRIGAFSEDPIASGIPWDIWSGMWISPEDLAQLVDRCLDADDLGFQILYGVSNNRPRAADTRSATRLVGYRPGSSAQEFAKSYKVVGGRGDLSQGRALLLRAAVLDHPQAVGSLQQWLQLVDIETEHLDPISYRLLPLVYQNLANQPVAHPLMSRLKGVYRRSWLENQLALQRLEPFVARLKEQGIEVLLLDDLTSILRLYDGQGLRRPFSLDLLVRPQDVSKTLTFLQKSNTWPKVSYGERFLEVETPLEIWSPLDLDLTLAWRIFPAISTHHEALEAWRNAVPAVLGNCAVFTADLETHFVRCCVRAYAARPEAAFFSMIDIAWMLRNSAKPLDWDRVIAIAQGNDQGFLVEQTLRQIAGLVELSKLTELLRRMGHQQTSLMERLEARVLFMYRLSMPMHLRILRRLFRYRRSIKIPGPIGWLRYLQYAWGGRRLLSLPRILLRHVGIVWNRAGRPT